MRAEEAARSKKLDQECQCEDQGATEQQPTAGPSAGNDLELRDLLADSFRSVRTPLADTNGDGEVVADDSVCYDMNCQICEPTHECQALLRTLERVLTDSDGPFELSFGRGTPTVESNPSSVEEGHREQANSPEAGRKEKKNGRRSSGWIKLRTHLSQLFPHKSAPNFSTRNESPFTEGAALTPSKPRFTKRFALFRRARRKPTAADF